jgi:hypothetical protein
MKIVVFAILSSLAVAAISASAEVKQSQRLGCDGNLPPGSYLESCYNCCVEYPYLQCDCGDGRGNYPFTEIYLPACGETPIANTYGNLTCN